MRKDLETIKTNFISIIPILKEIANKIEGNLIEILNGFEHIDRIGCRVKAELSFLDKTIKTMHGKLKYENPIQEIQDLIGARIVVYYKSDVDFIVTEIKKYYQTVEQNKIVPDDVMKFGYEGVHLICFIPNAIYSAHKVNKLIPDFFELQIKTLYQHAWSQAEHGLGYKTETSLLYEEERKLAFISAQSWGADTMLDELYNAQNSINN